MRNLCPLDQYRSASSIVRRTLSTDGSTISSRFVAAGTKEFLAATRVTGASRKLKQFCAIRAAISAPKPINRAVFVRDDDPARLSNALVDRIASSNGTIDLRSITSIEWPPDLQLAHGFEHGVNRAAPRHYRELPPFLANSATAERNNIVCIRLLSSWPGACGKGPYAPKTALDLRPELPF